jgi:hypothetical protein
MVISMIRWLVREDRGPRVRPAIPVPRLVLLTSQQMHRIFLVIEVLLPLAVIALGTVVWWRRR